MKNILIKNYNNLKQLNLPFKEVKNRIINHYVKGARLEILGDKKIEYLCKFYDNQSGKLVYETVITNNMWTKPNIEYFIDWRIDLYNNKTNKLIETIRYNATGKRVFIAFDSKAIGDTLAWISYVDEFRKQHKCKVICSTFHNDWFISQYPEIEFVSPGTKVENIYAMYTIGWYYNDKKVDPNKSPIDFKKHPLGQTASSILGLKFKEIKPKLNVPDKNNQIGEKYVVIAPHASAHAKYWNYPGGWQKVIDYLKDQGYKVVMITHERLGDKWHDSKLGGTLRGVIDKTGDYPIEDRMVDIKNADAFIGLGSGLSWISWALNPNTILISGFSKPYTEFSSCERIFNYDENICNGCFNREWLNPGDWEWCPDHKGTDRHFECTKTIKPEKVIKSLNKILNI